MRFTAQEHWVRVSLHLNGGFLRVEITDEFGERLNMPTFDLATVRIPAHLRSIGSRFLIRLTSIWAEEYDTVDEIRDALAESIEVICEV